MGYYTTYTLRTTQGYDNQEEIEEKLQEFLVTLLNLVVMIPTNGILMNKT